ncbi:MAG: DUF349 domain-containing protein [Cyclobacteriaceae bacterium]
MSEMVNDFSFFKDNQIWLKAYDNQPDRMIGELKDTEEKTLTYFTDRFTIIQNRVTQYLQKVEEATNKGSFLSGLESMREKIWAFNAIGDFSLLIQKVTVHLDEVSALVEGNKEKNKVQREELLAQAKELANSTDWLTTTEKIKALQQQWFKVGKASDADEKHLQTEFKEVLNGYFSRKKGFDEDRKELTQKKLATLKNIVNTAKQIDSKELEVSAKDKLNQLHEEWKGVGRLPKQANGLWEEFKKYSDSINKKAAVSRPNKKTVPKKEEKGGVAKEELLSQLKAVDETKLSEEIKEVKKLQVQWKSANGGNKKLNEVFYSLVNQLYEKEFLLQLLRRKSTSFDKMPADKKKAIAVKQLKFLIRKDEENNHLYNENADKLVSGSSNDAWSKLVKQRVDQQNNKLKGKQSILEEIEKGESAFLGLVINEVSSTKK